MSDVADLQARVERLAASDRARRDRNRDAMPATAAIIDGLRAAGIKPAWFRLSEAGRTVEWGRQVPDREVPPIPGGKLG